MWVIINKYQTAVDQIWLPERQTYAINDWLTADYVRHFAAAVVTTGRGIFYMAYVNNFLLVN